MASASPTMNVDDSHLTLRFKHGIHTVFLFIEPLSTTAEVSARLISVLRARFPDGLAASRGAIPTPLPEDDDLGLHTPAAASQLEYAVLVNSADATQGWRALRARPDEVFTNKPGVREGACVAFRFGVGIAGDDEMGEADAAGAAGEADDGDWAVEWPDPDEGYDDEME